jgi:hypothetical protein
MSVPPPKEINLLYNMPVTNFNEARMINYYAFKKIIESCSNFDLLPDIEKCICYKHSNIYSSSDEWSRLSLNVLSKLSLNFPIVYDIKKDKDGNLIIYYEKIKFNKIINDEKTKMRTDFVDEILFQKVLIGYTLYNLGYTSYTYYFDIYDIPPTTITFKIKDLFFVFTIKKLVILGSKTQIITRKTLESDHLNKIIQDVKNIIKKNEMYIKFFLENFIKYLDKKMIPTIPSQLIFETRLLDIENIQRGNFIKFINNNVYNYGILVDYLGEQCEIWHFSENKNKRDIIVILKKLPHEVYEKENLNFISQYYTIGDSLITCR